jgi:hypothetical protein
LIQQDPEFVPRPSALRYTDAEGVVRAANPRDTLYSAISFLATEYWDGKQWLRIDTGVNKTPEK